MSYIDTFDNELVGFFAGIPLYHPLETVEERAHADDFACSPDTIVLGGGSGEHPGIVVLRPDVVTAKFLAEMLNALPMCLGKKELRECKQYIVMWTSVLKPYLFLEWSTVFDFAGWKRGDYRRFMSRCRSMKTETPFGCRKEQCLNGWLAASLGEFIFFSMPELSRGLISSLDATAQIKSWIVRVGTGWLYRNVSLPAPNYPVSYGRKTVGGVAIFENYAWVVSRASGETEH